MQEVWKDIPGYEGFYQASSLGRIRSISKNLDQKNILKPTKCKYGYHYVTISKGFTKSQKRMAVHRAVLASFAGSSSLTVDHINGNKIDNNINNLRYLTRSENTKAYHLSLGHRSEMDMCSCYSHIKKHHNRFHARWHFRFHTKVNKTLVVGSFSTHAEAFDALIEFILDPEQTLTKYRKKGYDRALEQFKQFIQKASTQGDIALPWANP